MHCVPPKLSPRQAEIALLLRNGETYKSIAVDLHISEHTVEEYAQGARDRILAACPHIRNGGPRPVILRWYAYVESVAFAQAVDDAAA